MTQATRACAHCGQQHQRARAKYCTELCARRAYTKARTTDGRLAAARNTPEAKAKLKAWKQQNTERYKVERTCVVCGTTWMTQRKDAKYCTTECYIDGIRSGESQRRIVSKWVAGPCRLCGQSFVRPITGVMASYCSDTCKARDHEDRRRALERQAWVEPVRRREVFERDAWMCHLCGLPIDRTTVAPHPLSPSVDHVIALANGGEHSMANVRAAHFLCNSIKGDRTIKGRMPAPTPHPN